MRRYELTFRFDDYLKLRDGEPGYRLGARVLPRRFTVLVGRYMRFADDAGEELAAPRELSD